MYEYDDEVLEYFLAHQQQLFSEEVAETPEEAEEFLEDCILMMNPLRILKRGLLSRWQM